MDTCSTSCNVGEVSPGRHVLVVRHPLDSIAVEPTRTPVPHLVNAVQ